MRREVGGRFKEGICMPMDDNEFKEKGQSGICFYCEGHLRERECAGGNGLTSQGESVVQQKEQLAKQRPNLIKDETNQDEEGMVGHPFLPLKPRRGGFPQLKGDSVSARV